MKLVTVYFLVFFFFSCSKRERINKLLIKTWYIEDVKFESAEYANSTFFFNMITFNRDYVILPRFEIVGSNYAHWSYHEKEQEPSKYFIEIYGSPIDIFNGIYEIYYEKKSTTEKLVLKSEMVTLYCWR